MDKTKDEITVEEILQHYKVQLPEYSDGELFAESHGVARMEIEWKHKSKLTSAILAEMKRRQELIGLKSIPLPIGA